MTELAQVSLLLKAAKPVEAPRAADPSGVFDAILAALTSVVPPLPQAAKRAEPVETAAASADRTKPVAADPPRNPEAQPENSERVVAPVRPVPQLAKTPAQVEPATQEPRQVQADAAAPRPDTTRSAQPHEAEAKPLASSALAEIVAIAKRVPEQRLEMPKPEAGAGPERVNAPRMSTPDTAAPKSAEAKPTVPVRAIDRMPRMETRDVAAPRIDASVKVIDRTPRVSTFEAAAPKSSEEKPAASANRRAPVVAKREPAPEPNAAGAKTAEAKPAEAEPGAGRTPSKPEIASKPVAERPVQPPAPQAPASEPAAMHGEFVVTPQTATSAARPDATHAAAPTPPPPQAKPDIPALATAIAQKSRPGARLFEIRLDPPELGRVEVHLSVAHDGKAEAVLYADRPDTLQLLQRDSQNLERALKDAGLDVSNSSLNFSLKGEERQGDGGGASKAHGRTLSDAVVARSEAVNASLVSRSTASSDARLDIFV